MILQYLCFSMITEVWKLNSSENQFIDLTDIQIIDPTLSDRYYLPSMFLVDIGFCSKN